MFNQIPYMNTGSFFPTNGITNTPSILGKINWSTLLSNAQKTLNVVNQAVPLYYQVKPVFKNIKAISKIGKEFSKIGNNVNVNSNITIPPENNNTNYSNILESNAYEENKDIPTPIFFI